MPADIPDLRQIKSLVAIAETASFTKAAKVLFVTQSAVSHSIRGLEAQVGTTLVERYGKRISLTQDGVVFLRRCRRALHELETATRELDALRHWGQGRIRIGATNTLCHFMLPAVLREFRERYPRCELHIESGDTASLLGMLDEAHLDLALGIVCPLPPWAQVRELFEDELVFVVSPDHPWAALKRIPEEELSKESFLVYARKSETYRLTRAHFEHEGVRFRANLCLGDMVAIKEMAKLGIGVGIVAPWVARDELAEGSLVALPICREPLTRKWGVFHHAPKEFSEIEQAFLEICETVSRGVELAAPVGAG